MSRIVEPDKPAIDKTLFGHPRGLAYLTFTEAWERFSFSGMQALLVLYMVDRLLKPQVAERVIGFHLFSRALTAVYGPLARQPMSSAIFGLYTGLAFLTPVFGGLLGDRVLGQRRTVMLGAILMAAGHFMMASEPAFLFALAALVLGTGCLKGNISTQVGALYADTDPRRTSAFQIFSMGINLGVVVAPLVCGGLGEVFGWSWGFAAAGVGMLIGLATYVAGGRHLPPDRVAALDQDTEAPLRRGDFAVLPALALVFLLVTTFLVTAGQFGNVYLLWLREHVDRRAFGGEIPVTWFLSLTPLASIALAPLVVRVWAADTKPLRLGLPAKMAFGLALAAGAPAVTALLAKRSETGGPVPWVWLVIVHMMIALGYLATWPVGLALFARAAPRAWRAMAAGVFFISSFLASLIVGWVGGFYGAVPASTFWLWQSSFGGLGFALILVFGRALRAFPED